MTVRTAYVTTGLARRNAEAKLGRKNLIDFLEASWPLVSTEPYIENRHLPLVCEHLEAVTRREVRRLIISMPPGTAKSTAVAVAWPAWEWLNRPEEQSLVGSYDLALVHRDANRCRDLIKSSWYRETFRPDWSILRHVDAAGFFKNTEQGFRRAFFFGGRSVTGWRGGKVVVDDSLSVKNRYDRLVKDAVWDLYAKGLTTRVNDPNTAAFVVIAQRLADDDLTGRLLELGGYEHLCLPSRFEPTRRCVTRVGTDWRVDPGEPLFPALYGPERLNEVERELGPDDFSAQHQQAPVALGGVRFRSDDFLYWSEVPGTMGGSPLVYLGRREGTQELIRLDQCWTFCSADVAASEKNRADYTVIGVWAVAPKNDLLLLEMHRDRLSEPELIELAMRIHQRRNPAGAPHGMWFVEQNGLGLPIIQNLRSKGIPVLGVVQHKDKYSRSVTASVRVRSGQVFFPPRGSSPWLGDLERELTKFPFGDHDDMVDCLCLACSGHFEGQQIPTITGSTAVVAGGRPWF